MIHKTAEIDPGAELGEGVTVGPFSVIEKDVKVGDGCTIGPHVTVLPYTSIGPRCEIHAGAVLGDVPQDLGFEPAETYVEIGESCIIREGVTIHRGTKPGTRTHIGPRCFLMAFSHFAHNVELGERVIVANGALLAGYVVVGDGAFISGNAAVHQFCRVGRLAMLGGGAAASKDVPPFCMLRPAELNGIVGTNVVGMRRAGMDAAQRRAVQQAFKILFRSGLSIPQARARIVAEIAEPVAGEFAGFIDASQRGICGAAER